MKYLVTIIIASGLLFLANCDKPTPTTPEEIPTFSVPANFPPPVYNFSKNPVTKDGVILGRALFYDGILSKDGSISCGTCHQQPSAFTQHGHILSHGIDDLLTKRNSMPIQNLAWSNSFMWDGGIFDLDLFPPAPIQNTHEMAETMPSVLNKLRNSSRYPPLFKAAFGTEEITSDKFLKALSQFELVCVSGNSRYDKYIRNEGVTFTSDELAGLNLFKQKCATCHKGELFTDYSFRNNGISRKDLADLGRESITLDSADRYKFRVPSLRNVAKTTPYMHSGRYSTLELVLEHYNSGVQDESTLDNELRKNGQLGIPLTADEQQKIIAFLNTLTDDEFLTKKSLSEYSATIK